ncbi:CDP-diacylglycerol--serine O-phosphatidyltransferase, partial [Xenorhabdus bovienii]|nr:CDP-diacylglycerol--serine O-phosphatidyltransferase [Xenorhabdus bovienii]
AQLPKLPQSVADIETLYQSKVFLSTLLEHIANAQKHIYIAALYLENDDAGRDVLTALYIAKQKRPELDIKILVDWHRAQRG